MRHALRPALPHLAIVAALAAWSPSARCQDAPEPSAKVVRVVDGKQATAQIVGIDAPESVHPGKPVERFGKESAKHLRKAEREAREAKAGLWGDDPPAEPAKPAGAVVVFVTRTGAKYHAEGCRHLGASSSPLPLVEAAKTRAPCKACKPPPAAPSS